MLLPTLPSNPYTVRSEGIKCDNCSSKAKGRSLVRLVDGKLDILKSFCHSCEKKTGFKLGLD